VTGGWLKKTSFNLFKKAIEKYCLLDDGEKVLISVSGGIDSLVLTHLLNSYNLRRNEKWNILTVHIDQGFPKWSTKRFVRFFDSNQFNYLISNIDVLGNFLQITKAGERISKCFLCSRERRKRLFEIAAKEGINKIALAHHLEDINETFF